MAGYRRADPRQSWQARGHLALLISQREAHEAETRRRAVRLKVASEEAAHTQLPEVPSGRGKGISKPLRHPIRWYRDGRLDELLVLSNGLPIAKAVMDSMEDRRDRVVLCWPRLPENVFVAVALALHDGRAKGELSRATIAVWPWRHSLTAKAAHLLCSPRDLYAVARAVADDEQAKATWLEADTTAQHLHMVLSLRLQELTSLPDSGFRVTKPTLREITPAFPPVEGNSWIAPFESRRQFLERVASHTNIRKLKYEGYLDTLSSPEGAPIAIFGLPIRSPGELSRYLSFPRFADLGLDLVVVDATARSRDAERNGWEEGLFNLVTALDRMRDRRPGIVVLADDVFAARASADVLRTTTTSPRMLGRGPERIGALLEVDSLLAPMGQPAAHVPLAPVSYDADLKDGALVAFRRQALGLADRLRSDGMAEEAEAVRQTLAFIRRIANLPVGYAEGRAVVGHIHPGASFEDTAARARIFVDGGLEPLSRAMSAATGRRNEISMLLKAVRASLDAWETDTPISRKLRDTLARLGRDRKPLPLLVLPDADSLEMFQGSEVAATTGCRAVSSRGMLEAVCAQPTPWILVVKPSLEVLRVLLLSADSPARVSLLGDAAGAALLQAELRPLTQIDAFARVKARASALLQAVKSSEADLGLDREETRKPSTALANSMVLDFTQSGEGGDHYTGEVIRFVTRRGYALAYRPGSEILVHTPDEIRPFRRTSARNVEVGNAIVVLTPRLMATLQEALARAPKTVEALRTYHEVVANLCRALPGGSLRDKAREVVRRIRTGDPTFGDWEVHNVARWLSVDRDTVDDPAAPPNAPRDLPRFRRFAEAIGIPEPVALISWQHAILLTRSGRISDGLALHDRAVAFVIDPEGVQARAGERDLSGAWEQTLENVDTVEQKDNAHASHRA